MKAKNTTINPTPRQLTRFQSVSMRNYRIPAFADAPQTDVLFAGTHHALGPLEARGRGDRTINPVAPALANAIADATRVRLRALPFTPDRIYRPIFERHATG